MYQVPSSTKAVGLGYWMQRHWKLITRGLLISTVLVNVLQLVYMVWVKDFAVANEQIYGRAIKFLGKSVMLSNLLLWIILAFIDEEITFHTLAVFLISMGSFVLNIVFFLSIDINQELPITNPCLCLN